MDKKKILFCSMFIIFLYSCHDKKNKKFVEKFYPSGKIKTQGWYINDTIPVDTILTFFESGKILSKDIYDSTGSFVLNSITYYESNGTIHKIINYENNLINGFFSLFRESGAIASKGFFVNDKQTGDAYYYTQNGKTIRAYSFFDWQERPINLIKYDSIAGNVRKDMRQVIYIDTLSYSEDKSVGASKNILFCDIQIIISNPPQCRSTIKVDYISKNGVLMKTDSITSEPYYLKKEKFPDSLLTIKIWGSQYDSVKNKTVYQNISKKLD